MFYFISTLFKLTIIVINIVFMLVVVNNNNTVEKFKSFLQDDESRSSHIKTLDLNLLQ